MLRPRVLLGYQLQYHRLRRHQNEALLTGHQILRHRNRPLIRIISQILFIRSTWLAYKHLLKLKIPSTFRRFILKVLLSKDLVAPGCIMSRRSLYQSVL